ncbi:Centlein, partial [Galemys pyrenaicus]
GQRARDPARQGGKRLAHARLGASGSPGWGRGGGVSKRELDPLAAAAMAACPSSSSFPPSSPAPSPPTRRLGPSSPRVGRGAVVHAVRSEASGLADAAWEGVRDKSDMSWQGEEGAVGRRGPGQAAAVQAPLLSSPVGSKPLEGISVEEAMVTRTQLLEEELSSLKEELALCQADKEFVWSLWKRLQVTNPDLTQAVSLVVE